MLQVLQIAFHVCDSLQATGLQFYLSCLEFDSRICCCFLCRMLLSFSISHLIWF